MEKAQAEANHSAVISEVEQLQSTISQLQQELHVCQRELEWKKSGSVTYLIIVLRVHVQTTIQQYPFIQHSIQLHVHVLFSQILPNLKIWKGDLQKQSEHMHHN